MKKSKIISRPAKVFCMLFVVIMLFSTMTMANAGNWTDSTFTYSGWISDGVFTPERVKEDATPAYAYNVASSTGLYIDVYGSDGYGNAVCRTAYNYGILAVGQSRYYSSYVYERNHPYAQLFIWANSSTNEYVHIKWSPDSIGS